MGLLIVDIRAYLRLRASKHKGETMEPQNGKNEAKTEGKLAVV